MAITTFRDEISRLKKGIRIAWIINFAIIWILCIAIGVVFTLSTRVSNQQLATQMLIIAAISLVISIIVMFFVSNYSTRILLEAPAGDAVHLSEGQIFNIVEEMAIAANLPKIPEVYLLRGSGVANAYACADNLGNTQVVITQELLDVLNNREELQGVIGHEIGHIVEGDSQAMTKLVALTSTTALIAGAAGRMMFWGGGRRSNDNREGGNNPLAIVIIIISFIFLIVAPLLAKVAESYMSRERESRADASSVQFTRNPTALASALLALERGSRKEDKQSLKNFNQTIGPVAFFNPMSLKMSLSTHPTTRKRIEKLREMGAQIDPDNLQI
ncbi:MAG TPA: M48 family metalloprotease [Lactovum miscens]|uniref:M48 family metalloprotease n=1 Tax=Lactovum miscens TaxID=190387 RepID=UPI002ED79FA3